MSSMAAAGAASVAGAGSVAAGLAAAGLGGLVPSGTDVGGLAAAGGWPADTVRGLTATGFAAIGGAPPAGLAARAAAALLALPVLLLLLLPPPLGTAALALLETVRMRGATGGLAAAGLSLVAGVLGVPARAGGAAGESLPEAASVTAPLTDTERTLGTAAAAAAGGSPIAAGTATLGRRTVGGGAATLGRRAAAAGAVAVGAVSAGGLAAGASWDGVMAVVVPLLAVRDCVAEAAMLSAGGSATAAAGAGDARPVLAVGLARSASGDPDDSVRTGIVPARAFTASGDAAPSPGVSGVALPRPTRSTRSDDSARGIAVLTLIPGAALAGAGAAAAAAVVASASAAAASAAASSMVAMISSNALSAKASSAAIRSASALSSPLGAAAPVAAAGASAGGGTWATGLAVTAAVVGMAASGTDVLDRRSAALAGRTSTTTLGRRSVWLLTGRTATSAGGWSPLGRRSGGLVCFSSLGVRAARASTGEADRAPPLSLAVAVVLLVGLSSAPSLLCCTRGANRTQQREARPVSTGGPRLISARWGRTLRRPGMNDEKLRRGDSRPESPPGG